MQITNEEKQKINRIKNQNEKKREKYQNEKKGGEEEKRMKREIIPFEVMRFEIFTSKISISRTCKRGTENCSRVACTTRPTDGPSRRMYPLEDKFNIKS